MILEYLHYICGIKNNELKFKIMIKNLFKLIFGLIIGAGGIATVAALALLSGTIVWLIWPVAVPIAFPGLVENGTLAASLPWWGAVCLTWLMGILVKSNQTNNNN